MKEKNRFGQEIGIYRNSIYDKCVYRFNGELKIKKHPFTNKDIIICKGCWIKLTRGMKGNKKDEK